MPGQCIFFCRKKRLPGFPAWLVGAVVVVLLGVGTGNSLAESGGDALVDIRTWKTKTGIPVYYVEREQLPMVDIAVLVDAGSVRDGQQPGLAQLTARLLTQGTQQFSTDAIASGFDAVGADFSAAASRDMTVLHLRTTTDDAAINQSTALFQSILSEPNFPNVQLQRVRKQTLTGLKLREQNAGAKAADLFYQHLYPNGPYQYPVSGTSDSVSHLSRDDVLAFYKRYFVSGNMKVIIVGEVDAVEAKALANRITQNIPTQTAAKPLTLPTPTGGQTVKQSFPGPQTAVVMGQLGINRQSPDYFALVVGNRILGSLPFYSRLFTQVREKQGLSYHVASDLSPLKHTGPFTVVLQTQNKTADKAIEVAQKTIAEFLQHGPKSSELAIAKQNISGQFPLAFASNASITQQLAMLAFYDLPLNYFDTYREHINNVTRTEVQAAFNQLLQRDQWLLVRVGNA